ncbi:MAG TPA: hypothetical protein VIM11_01465 [Tepidisphaeraceae bacterium]
MFRVGCVVMLVLLFAIPAIASRFMPWWGIPLVLVGEVVVLVKLGPALVKYGVKRFAMGLFLTKSRVLKGATVEVHEVLATTRPVKRHPPAELEAADEGGRVEVTAADGSVITMPAESEKSDSSDDDEEETEERDEGEHDVDEDDDAEEAQRMRDLRFVMVDFTITPVAGASKMQHYDPSELMLVPINSKIKMDEDPTADGSGGSVETVKLIEESGAEVDEFDKVTGKQRLRVVFGCPPGLTGRVKFRYYFEAFGELGLP